MRKIKPVGTRQPNDVVWTLKRRQNASDVVYVPFRKSPLSVKPHSTTTEEYRRRTKFEKES